MGLFGKNAPDAAGREKGRSGTGVPRAAEVPGHGESRPSVIGSRVRIQGELSGDEDILLDGRVDGRVAVTKALRVGASGHVNADVSGRTIAIAGRVVGNVTATERVELLPTAYVEGNIRAPKIVISEGAQFKGSVEMGAEAPAPPVPPGPMKGL
jgi:cytoskeletal protein CcmA (bactofilin family)